ncbi:hypothetical protein [Streptomyces roseolilacinus]|uniref:Uncharacterized protein n=1 Tax=Streptomyces roseolilacinus TaxID=66904 RepID=A0A918AW66_9ACTN|nr:hypothetical protein [Streptomyces roseolilacinus]GGP91635.1 hypothetical protein GCM10010249_07090 [Streptomyces roseolilacinus]
MPVRSAWLINRTTTDSGQTRSDTRLAPTGTMAPSGALTTMSGVIPGSQDGRYIMDGLYVYGDTAGMTANVAPGRAVIQGSPAAGAYPVVVTDYTQVTFDDGDANNPRVDLVLLRAYDAQFDPASGRTEAVLEILKGAPAPAPEPLPVPEGALALARVHVPAGASVGTGGLDWSKAVYDLRHTTVAAGGILAESWNRDSRGGYAGQYRDNASQLQRWDGTRWVSYPRHLGGIAPQGALAAGEYAGQYRDEGGRLQRWDGAVWRPIVPVTGWAFNNDGGYCTSTTWVEAITDTAHPSISAQFTTPVSGTVLITVGYLGDNSVDGAWSQMSAVVRLDGAVVLAADDQRAAQATGKDANSVVHTFRLAGLKPHTVYTATGAYRSSATSNNAWVDNRFLRVDPVL